MLSNFYREHIENQAIVKQKQEKRKRDLLLTTDQLTRRVLNDLNDDVSECYKNEKRIDQSCKQLSSQTAILVKQSEDWIHLIGQLTSALKELGDVDNYCKFIERECLIIAETLSNVENDFNLNK